MKEEKDEEHERPTARGWASNSGFRTDDSSATRAIKILILAAPWVVGVIVFWRYPLYLAIFLGVGTLFAILQRRWPTSTNAKRSRGNDERESE